MEETGGTLKCTNCNKDIPKGNYEIHSAHCVRNIRNCTICNEPVPITMMQDHIARQHSTSSCPSCGEEVCAADMEDHVRDSCALTAMPCRFCNLELPRADLPNHETYCGTRTEQCPECKSYVMIKYKTIHLDSNHGFIKLNEDVVSQQESSRKHIIIRPPQTYEEFISLLTRRSGEQQRVDVEYVRGNIINMQRRQRNLRAPLGPAILDELNLPQKPDLLPSVPTALLQSSLPRTRLSSDQFITSTSTTATTSPTTLVTSSNAPLTSSEPVNDGSMPSTSGVSTRSLKRPVNRKIQKGRKANSEQGVIFATPISHKISKKCLPLIRASLGSNKTNHSLLVGQTEVELSARNPEPEVIPTPARETRQPRETRELREVTEPLGGSQYEVKTENSGVAVRDLVSSESHDETGIGLVEAHQTFNQDMAEDYFGTLTPMNSEDFIERFQLLRLQPEVNFNNDDIYNESSETSISDRFMDIRRNLSALRRNLNEVRSQASSFSAQPSTSSQSSTKSAVDPGTDDIVHIPCEFCGRQIEISELSHHQETCVASPLNHKQAGGTPMVPCETCNRQITIYSITKHQRLCQMKMPGEEESSDDDD